MTRPKDKYCTNNKEEYKVYKLYNQQDLRPEYLRNNSIEVVSIKHRCQRIVDGSAGEGFLSG